MVYGNGVAADMMPLIRNWEYLEKPREQTSSTLHATCLTSLHAMHATSDISGTNIKQHSNLSKDWIILSYVS